MDQSNSCFYSETCSKGSYHIHETAGVVLGSPKLTHVRTMLTSLNWLPVESHSQFKVMVLLYKALNVYIPYIKELVQPYQIRPGLQPAKEQFLIVTTNPYKLQYGNPSFAIFACYAHNNLPHDIHNSLTLDCLKSPFKSGLCDHFVDNILSLFCEAL